MHFSRVIFAPTELKLLKWGTRRVIMTLPSVTTLPTGTTTARIIDDSGFFRGSRQPERQRHRQPVGTQSGIVELFFPNSPFSPLMTNIAGLGGTNVTCIEAIPRRARSVWNNSTNLTGVGKFSRLRHPRYLFSLTQNATRQPQRYYRLHWP